MLPNLYFQKEIQSLIFLKDTPNVMYVGPELSEADKAMLTAIGASMVFVQDVLAKLSKEVMEYNFPGVVLPEGFSVESINAQILSELEFGTDSSHYILVHFENGQFSVYDAETHLDKLVWYLKRLVDRPEKPKLKRCLRAKWRKMSDFSGNLYDAVQDFGKELSQEEQMEVQEDTDDIRFSVRPSKPEIEECRKFREPDIRFRVSSSYEAPPQADQTFSAQMENEAAEVEKMVKGLLLRGFPAKIIKTWIAESVKLSRLRITRQYTVLLVDYDKEVKMGPLPMTVFLFYLRHPEGVKFSYLQDHVKELREIYGRVSVNDDPQRMEDSIASLINPFSNSICEKCAAVKRAFMTLVDDEIACHYYITGMQGGKKGISLDRSLVEWECEL